MTWAARRQRVFGIEIEQCARGSVIRVGLSLFNDRRHARR
jgi:hypothetical protein